MAINGHQTVSHAPEPLRGEFTKRFDNLIGELTCLFRDEMLATHAELHTTIIELQKDNEVLRLQLLSQMESAKSLSNSNLSIKVPRYQIAASIVDHEMQQRQSCLTIPEALHCAPDPILQATSPLRSGSSLREECYSEFPVFSEQHLVIASWNCFNVLIVLLGSWADTLSWAQKFDTDNKSALGSSFDWFLVSWYSFDILMSFNTDYEDSKRCRIRDRRSIIKHYVRTWFVIDVLATLPWDEIFNAFMKSSGPGLGFLKVLKLGKMVRLAKILKALMNKSKLHKFQDQVDELIMVILQESSFQKFLKLFRVAKAVGQMFFCIWLEVHILALVLLPYAEGEAALSWTYDGKEGSQYSPWMKFAIITRWSTEALATGAINLCSMRFVLSIGSRLLLIAMEFIHLANLLLAISIFSNVKGSDDMDFEYRMRALGLFLRKQERVSRLTRQTVINYHRVQANKRQTHLVRSLVDDLPNALKKTLHADMYGPVVENFRLFSQGSFSDSENSGTFIIEICSLLRSRFHADHEPVVTKGTILEGMFCTMSGKLVLSLYSHYKAYRSASQLSQLEGPPSRAKSELIATQACPTFFGIECLFAPDTPKWQSSAITVVTETAAEVALVSRKAFDKLLVQIKEWSSFVQFIRTKVSDREVDPSSLYKGIDDEILREFCYHIPTEVVSEDLGVSCEYICSRFKEDVQEALSDTNFDSHTFGDLSKHFWGEQGGFRGFMGCASKVCPRDGLEGCAIVDALDEKYNGNATHFVSWCWAYTVDSVVTALFLWAQEHDIDVSQTFFWMCFFCNNQRRVLIAKDPPDFVDTFGQRLKKIGQMVLLFDTYTTPTYITRLWCIFETYTAASYNIPIEVALPASSKESFHKQLRDGGFRTIAASLTQIDVTSARASVESDEQKIKSLIRCSIGFAAVNDAVKCALTHWLALAFEDCLKSGSVSEITQAIFKLIMPGKHLFFHLREWLQAARHHPDLLKFLELDGCDPQESFEVLEPNADGAVSKEGLEHFLKIHNKCNIETFAAWLCSVQKDQVLVNIQQEVKSDLQQKIANQHMQLSQHEAALNLFNDADLVGLQVFLHGQVVRKC